MCLYYIGNVAGVYTEDQKIRPRHDAAGICCRLIDNMIRHGSAAGGLIPDRAKKPGLPETAQRQRQRSPHEPKAYNADGVLAVLVHGSPMHEVMAAGHAIIINYQLKR